jgi:diguanylate cyclase (GGDEF)-like protein
MVRITSKVLSLYHSIAAVHFLADRPAIGQRALSMRTKQQIDISQLTTRCRLAIAMSIAGSCVALAFFFSFHSAQRSITLDLAVSALVAGYGFLALMSRKWISEDNKEFRYPNSMRSLVATQLWLGTAWAVLLVLAIKVANGDQRCMIYATTIALMSTTMVSGPARYSFSAWTPITVGAFITIFFDPSGFYEPIMIALVSYSFLTFYIILMICKQFFEKEKNLFEIKRHAETIELLLKDFQDGSGSFLWETNAEHGIKDFGGNVIFGSIEVNPVGLHFIQFLRLVLGRCRLEMPNELDDPVSIIRERLVSARPFKDIILRQDSMQFSFVWAISGKPIFDEFGQLCGFRGLWSDVTAREEFNKALTLAACQDGLTKLFNRTAFRQKLSHICKGDHSSEASLLCLDLDQFKRVNDDFGHPTGDELLIQVAQELKCCVSLDDQVFRIGGDEFAIILSTGGYHYASAVAQRVIDRLSIPFSINDLRLRIGTSIGISRLPVGDVEPDEMHRNADAALYHSKACGKASYTFFEDIKKRPFSLQNAIEMELRSQIPLDQLHLVFEPILNLETRKIISAEALLRWRHPRLGTIAPNIFIPMIEKTGQISRVGLFAIEQALRILAKLPDQVAISVNISPLQLSDIDLPRKISSAIAAAAIHPKRLELEITESSLLERDLQRLQILEQIRALGCGIALDDFGTGYASLLLLEQFPFSKIKIDRSFVRGQGDEVRRHLILTSIIKLATDLGICIVAEGIETLEQAWTMREFGCLLGQGFGFFPSLSEENFFMTVAEEAFFTGGAPVKHVA